MGESITFAEEVELKLTAFRNATQDYQRRGLGTWLLRVYPRILKEDALPAGFQPNDLWNELIGWSDRDWAVDVPEKHGGAVVGPLPGDVAPMGEGVPSPSESPADAESETEAASSDVECKPDDPGFERL